MNSEPVAWQAEATAPGGDPCAFVCSYLAAMERRDLALAQRHVAPDAQFVFPGGVRRRGLAEIASGSAARYRSIGKHIDRCDRSEQPDGTTVVYVLGRLHGTWPDGEAFDGIRFVDRFELRDGLICRQDVWNDSGEARIRKDGA